MMTPLPRVTDDVIKSFDVRYEKSGTLKLKIIKFASFSFFYEVPNVIFDHFMPT